MRRVIIIAKNFYSTSSGAINIGGVETYVKELIYCLRNKYNFIVVQPGCRYAEILIDGINVKIFCENKPTTFVKKLERDLLADDDILLFSTEQWSCPTLWPHVAVVQHGIYWDLPIELYSKGIISKTFPFFYKLFDLYRNYKKIKPFKKIVCVDYIYPIWFKTIFSFDIKKFTVFLNFTSFVPDIVTRPPNVTKKLRFLFARRFVDIRGVDLVVEIAKKILLKYPEISFYFVGDGPRKNFLIESFREEKNVYIFSAKHDDMKNIISSCDVVLIPSIGSEGTSLIAIESMALGKVVVASSVGGLTNIIINGFNGFLCDTDANSFFLVIEKIIDDNEILSTVGKNAQAVASSAFSRNRWALQWGEYLNDL